MDEQNKELIDHCMDLYNRAAEKCPREKLQDADKIYDGIFDDSNFRSSNYLNIVQPIVDTIVSLVLDSHVTTQVRPNIGSFANMNAIKSIFDIADIVNDCVEHVKRLNKDDLFNVRILKDAVKYGIGLAKTRWDQDKNKNLGDAIYEVVNPKSFFPDPDASDIDDCKYIVLKNKYSALKLKAKYPEFAEKIDNIVSSGEGKSSGKMSYDLSKQITYNVNSTPQATYVTKGSFNSFKNEIDVFEVYLKDDSTFIPEIGQDQEKTELDIQQSIKTVLQYPNGRLIVFAGKDLILEDREIDSDFGFPFTKINYIDNGTFWGTGICEKLKRIQFLINRALGRIYFLEDKFISIILSEKTTGLLDDRDLVRKMVKVLEPGSLSGGKMPQVLTNNTLSEIRTLTDYVQYQIQMAYKMSRINEMMINGERPTGVNSGEMVQQLNESPLASIRELQRSFYEFSTSNMNKVIKLIQMYYNIPRVIRIGDGNEFTQILPSDSGNQMDFIKFKADSNYQAEIVKTFKSDLNITDFECEIVSGSEMPRSRSSRANMVLQLAKMGLLGDLNSIDTRRFILSNLDLQGYRALLKEQEESQNNLIQNPPPPPVDKISLAYKDLPPTAQAEILVKNGLYKMNGLQ